MSIANVFLSHSSSDKPLVEMVANALCRRGITPWLDIQRLTAGVSITEKLKEAISQQTAVALFLSKSAAASKWVQEELSEAFHLEDEGKNKDWILPIYLSDPKEIVLDIPLLAERWLTPDRDRLDRLGIAIDSLDNTIKNSNEATADYIAQNIAKSLYHLLQFKEKKEINIVIDQRRQGLGSLDYTLPQNIERADCPTLVFRPDTSMRTITEILHGEKWQQWTRTIHESLSEALGMIANKKIRILGDGQLGLAYFLGHYFDRSNCVFLHCHSHRHNTVFTNDGQSFYGPLTGGNPDCESTIENNPQDSLQPPKIKPGEEIKAIALYIGKNNYLPDVNKHIQSLTEKFPLVFVATGDFNHSDEAMKLVRDIVALLQRLKEQNGLKAIRFYCGLPFNVIPLLSANLVHVIDNVEFMEYRRDLKSGNPPAQDTYIHLPMSSQLD